MTTRQCFKGQGVYLKKMYPIRLCVIIATRWSNWSTCCYSWLDLLLLGCEYETCKEPTELISLFITPQIIINCPKNMVKIIFLMYFRHVFQTQMLNKSGCEWCMNKHLLQNIVWKTTGRLCYCTSCWSGDFRGKTAFKDMYGKVAHVFIEDQYLQTRRLIKS